MFYGWKIVGVTLLTHFVSVGFVFYSYGVFFNSLTEEFGGSRLGVSIGLAMMNVATGCFAPFLGRLLDHGSIRNVMCCGAISMAIGFFLSSQITALWQYYLVLVTFLGLGAAAVGGIPGSTLVAKWFVRQRGKALGISTMGVSSSGMIMAPLSTLLIAEFGWRVTFIVYGITTLVVVVPVVWFFVINRPEDIGSFPDGDRPPNKAEREDALDPAFPLAPGDQLIDHATHIEWSGRAVMRDPNFWVIVVAIALNFFANGAMLTHMVPHGTDLGYTLSQSAFVLSASAGVGVLGKLVFGWITDRVASREAMWVAIAFQIVGVLMTLYSDSYTGLLLAGSVYGFGMGGIMPLWASLVGECFDRHSFGRVMGLMSPCMVPLQTFGIPFAGYVYDRMGSYDIAFWTFIGVYAIATVALVFQRRRDIKS